MTTNVYVHIGTHKTGTTAVQQYLIKKTKTLLKSGFKYINLYHFEEAQKLMQYSGDNQTLLTNLKSFFNAQKEDNIHSYIICCEYLSGNPKTLYSNVSEIPKLLSQALIGFDRIKVFAVLRRQDQFIQSIYTQYVHQGEDIPLGDFLDPSRLDNLKWTGFLSKYEDEFGADNVVAIPYDIEAFKERSLLSSFSNFCGIDMFKDSELEVLNSGYNDIAIKIAKSCNPLLNVSEKKILRSFLQKHFKKNRYASYHLLNEEDERFLISYFKKDNSLLFKTYFKTTDLSNFSAVEEETKNGINQESNHYPELISYLIKEIDQLQKSNPTQKPIQSKNVLAKVKKKLKKMVENPHELYQRNYQLIGLAKNYERAVILGSAESINKLELTAFSNDFVITVGNFFEHPDINAINPKIHVFAASHPPITKAVLMNWWGRCQDVLPKSTPILIEKRDREVAESVFKGREVYYYSYGGSLPVDFTKPVMSPWSVTIVAIQLAIYGKIPLIGLLGINHDWQCIEPYRHFYDHTEPSLEYYLKNAGIEIEYEKQKQRLPKERLYREYELFKQYETLKDEGSKLGIGILNYDPFSNFDVFEFDRKTELIRRDS
ncbi:hypothetical protein [Winogradskyella aurantia]|uniref:Uncharacterized protein n=1 Tax=Winogradskyella aurantia TaxID=1915063 RepID=A0A265UR64_9FLAO|nr:hypothetical protein [Winogradskyella aurantia]OZV67577.1 hypothetical protein CA834_11540 [Winogradskyella aurantia]